MERSPGAPADPAIGARNVLLLYADTGGGHRASARAIADEIVRASDGRFNPVLFDPFVEASPRLLTRAVALYSPLIRHAPWLWGTGWWLTDSRAATRAMRASVLRFVQPGLAAAIARHDPAAVISFHPLLTDVLARVVHAPGAKRRPLVTVITDLVDIHASWTCPNIDVLVTGSPAGLARLRRAGIPADRCHDLGLPVGSAFLTPAPAPSERAALRRRLDLAVDTFTVMVSGGAEGSGGMLGQVQALVQSRLPIQIVAICGRNAVLEERLRRVHGTVPGLLVRGFVNNMADWMRASDVIATKAGPGTIAEALCCALPLLITSYVPGQERGNVHLVVDTGAGRWVPRPKDLVEAVRELSASASPSLAGMRAAVRAAARPHATRRITSLVLELMDRPAASGGGALSGEPPIAASVGS